jgi:hypothetical protein
MGFDAKASLREDALRWLMVTDARTMELVGDAFVERAKELGASDEEIDDALRCNMHLWPSGSSPDDIEE